MSQLATFSGVSFEIIHIVNIIQGIAKAARVDGLKLTLDVLYQIILPIFLILAVGFVAGRKLLFQANPGADSTDERDLGRSSEDSLNTLSTLIFYIFAPCLAFWSLATSDVGAQEMGQIGLFVLLVTLFAGATGWVLARTLRLPPRETSSLLLVVMFGNVGNYGLPLNELALGQKGMERAIIYMTSSSIIIFSLGILIAAHAQNNSLSQVLSRMVRFPILYALLLAGLVRGGLLPVPGPVLDATEILARGTVPLMLLILGVQLSRLRVRENWRLVGLASGLRLLLGPLSALLLAGIMGLEGLTGQVSIIEAGMPSAVFTIILAKEFDLALDLTTGVVFVTTLFSPATLVPLIAFLL